jgi:hypothetical protein
MSWRDKLRHAFAVEKPEAFEPTEDERRVAERVCDWLTRRGLGQVALLALEAHRGLNYYSAHALHFFRPLVAALFDTRDYRVFSEMLERRGSIDFLVRRIESFEETPGGKEPRGLAEGSGADTAKRGKGSDG